jgi:hypothetical protein
MSTANWRGVSPLALASEEKMSAAHWPARCSKCIAERLSWVPAFAIVRGTALFA